MSRRFMTIALLLALTLVAVPLGLAAKGGNGGGNGNGNSAAGGGPNGGSEPVSSSISLDQAGQTLALGSTVTFTTTVAGLHAQEYPMVYVECYSATDGSLVYGQLDYPSTAFVLGGGSSQWWIVGGHANCLAHLYAYGGKSQGSDTIREFASPVAFAA